MSEETRNTEAPASAVEPEATPPIAEAPPSEEAAAPTPVEEAAASDAPAPPAVEEAAAKPVEATPSTDAESAEPAEAASPAEGAAAPAADAKAEAPKGEEAPKKKGPGPRQASLYRALRSGRPVSGRIEKIIKGGYEVRLGKARGFCPHSQMDLMRVEDAEQHLGQSYFFKVTQVRRGGEDVVVSRRQLLEVEQKENAKSVRAALVAGSVVEGKVASVADFGAFVDVGAGVRGLVHVSEVSHNRVEKVAQAVSVGDAVQVKILKIDDDRGRISLSIRQATADPWSEAAERFQPGSAYPGKVLRLTDFGAFVELAPGIEALAPGSEFPPSEAGWREQLPVGSEHSWLVLAVDPRRRRISLTLPVEGMTDPTVEPGATLKGRVQRVERFGVFVWLGPGKVGLMPAPFTGTPRGSDLSHAFRTGEEVEVEVVDIEEDGRRIRLAKPGAYNPETAPPPRPPRRDRDRDRGRDRGRDRPREPASTQVQTADSGTFGTTLADKLKAALGTPDASSPKSH